MARIVSIGLLALLCSCYESHEPGTPTPMDGGVDGDAALESPFSPSGECPAWLQAGAPSAVAGYCPTNTNRSAFAMPSSQPELRWELEVPADRNVRMVVGPGGRIYMVDGEELYAIDDTGPTGEIAWSAALGGRVQSPQLLADGTIFVMTSSVERRGDDFVSRRECVWLDSVGDIRRRVDAPIGLDGAPIVDGRGNFILTSREDDRGRLVALDPDCRELWRSELFVTEYPIVQLSPNGQLVAIDRFRDREGGESGSEVWVMGIDAGTGERIFRASLGGDALRRLGPAVGDDGAIHVTIMTDTTSVLNLVVLEPDGRERLRIALPEPPWGGGVSSLSVASDGTTFIKEGRSLMAVGTNGDVLWALPTHPNIDAVATLDDAGLILIGSGGGRGVDARDGTIRWTSEIPAHQTMRPGGGVSIAFPGPSTIGDGTLYYMADDGLLHAASTAR